MSYDNADTGKIAVYWPTKLNGRNYYEWNERLAQNLLNNSYDHYDAVYGTPKTDNASPARKSVNREAIAIMMRGLDIHLVGRYKPKDATELAGVTYKRIKDAFGPVYAEFELNRVKRNLATPTIAENFQTSWNKLLADHDLYTELEPTQTAVDEIMRLKSLLLVYAADPNQPRALCTVARNLADSDNLTASDALRAIMRVETAEADKVQAMAATSNQSKKGDRCAICRRNNHKTEDCRVKKPGKFAPTAEKAYADTGATFSRHETFLPYF
ncbi:hypothetical protein HOO65_080092 [Ceratocystis lukuohia]|uniref:Uncharacterized protein n=2 Tax=Ceratocystis TaxID=5157 RepID=A0A0F8BIY4_CERFI|nr:hypothetical protein CFO_g5493 [Ceratocystis platani]